jgi:hypothetical protein
VSILFGNHGNSRRRGDFYRRAVKVSRKKSAAEEAEENVPNLNNNLNNNKER